MISTKTMSGDELTQDDEGGDIFAKSDSHNNSEDYPKKSSWGICKQRERLPTQAKDHRTAHYAW